MRFAKHPILACLALLTLGLAGCATTPQHNVGVVAPAPVVERRPEPAVNPAVQRQFNEALRLMKLGQFNEAERMLRGLTQAAPELPGPYANLGIVYFRLGKMPEAVEALKKAIAINPDQAAYYNQLGIVYRQRGQLDEARSAYARALSTDPNYSSACLNMGILYDLYLRDATKALSYYERYQGLQSSADAQVSKWIIDLKQRTHATETTARKEHE